LDAFVNTIKEKIEELNKGNYGTLQGFELITPEQKRNNKQYIAGIVKKLTPLLALFKDKTNFSITDYEKAYKELFTSQGFIEKIPQERLAELQNSLMALFNGMAEEYNTKQSSIRLNYQTKIF